LGNHAPRSHREYPLFAFTALLAFNDLRAAGLVRRSSRWDRSRCHGCTRGSLSRHSDRFGSGDRAQQIQRGHRTNLARTPFPNGSIPHSFGRRSGIVLRATRYTRLPHSLSVQAWSCRELRRRVPVPRTLC
jgi:hypothetical protein